MFALQLGRACRFWLLLHVANSQPMRRSHRINQFIHSYIPKLDITKSRFMPGATRTGPAPLSPSTSR